MSEFNVANIVKGTGSCKFLFYRQQHMYYKVKYKSEEYKFPISIDDVGSGTLESDMKPLTLMRWIRLAIEQGSFIKVS